MHRWFEFHGTNRTASVHKHHPLPKVEAKSDRDRGVDALLHTASMLNYASSWAWHGLLEWDVPKLQQHFPKPCSANNLDAVMKVMWRCLAFRLLTSNLEMAKKVGKQGRMSYHFQSLAQLKTFLTDSYDGM